MASKGVLLACVMSQGGPALFLPSPWFYKANALIAQQTAWTQAWDTKKQGIEKMNQVPNPWTCLESFNNRTLGKVYFDIIII